MKNKTNSSKRKKVEKEYLLSIKLLIVNEIELGKLTVKEAQRKYRIVDSATIRNWLVEYGRM